MQIRRSEKCVWQNRTAEREETDLGLQDDRMSGNIQDIARLITRLLLKGDMPQYTLPAAEADDPDYLELALTFYLHLNDMDVDYLDDHDYSREEILDGLKSLAEDWGVTGLEALV